MAYHDQNGNITIDDEAAKRDVQRMKEAISYLTESRDRMRKLMEMSSSGQGEALSAITEKAGEMINKINDMIARLDESIGFINKTVQHYFMVDQEIKKAVQSSGGNE